MNVLPDPDATPEAGVPSASGRKRDADTADLTGAAAPAGERFGMFVKHLQIASGAASETWKAWDEPRSVWVALRIFATTPGLRERLAAASRAGAGVPSVAGVQRAGLTGGRTWAARPWIEGVPLSRMPTLTPRACASVAREAAEALAALHAKGHFHGHVTAENLIVTTDGGGRAAAVLTDPGLAAGNRGEDVRALTAVLREVAPEGAGLVDLLSRGYGEARELARELGGWEDRTVVRARPRRRMRALVAGGAALAVTAVLIWAWDGKGSRGNAGPEEGGGGGEEAREDTPQKRLAALQEAVAGVELSMNDAARLSADAAAGTRVGISMTAAELRTRLEPFLKDVSNPAAIHLLRARAADVAGDDAGATADAIKAVRADTQNQEALVLLCRLCARAAFMREEGPRGERLLLHPISDAALVLRRQSKGAGARPVFDAEALSGDEPIATLARASTRLSELRAPTARVTEAALQIVLGQSRNAVAVLASVTDASSPDVAWARAVCSAERDSDRAASFDAAVAAAPADPLLRFTRARLRWSAGDSRGALEDLDMLLALRPAAADARLERAACRFLMGDVIAAEADLDVLPAIPEIAAASRVLVARHSMLTGNHLGAMRACEEVLRRLPGFLPALIAHAESLSEAGDPDMKLEDSRVLLQSAPWNPEAMSVRARMLYFTYRLGAAQDAIEEAMALAPEHPVVLSDRAMILAWIGKVTEAEVDAKRAVELAPLLPRARLSLVNVYEKSKDVAGRRRELERGVEAIPGDFPLWCRLGNLLNRLGEFDPAMRAAERAEALAPGGTEPRMIRACVLSGLGNFAEALVVMDPMVAQFPDDAMIRRTRARIRLDNGDAAGAFEDAWKTAELAPHWGEAMLLRGLARSMRGDAPGARADFERARDLSPEDAEVLSSLGQSYFEGGETARAKVELERATKLDPDFGPAWCALGEVKLAEGDADGARAAFRKALEKARRLEDEVVKRANAGLAKLEK